MLVAFYLLCILDNRGNGACHKPIEAMEHVINLEVEYEARCLGYKAYPGGFKIVMSELSGVIDTISLPE